MDTRVPITLTCRCHFPIFALALSLQNPITPEAFPPSTLPISFPCHTHAHVHFLLASGSGCNSSLPVVCLLVHGVGSSYTPSRSVPSAWGFRLAVLGLGVMDPPESMYIYVPGRLLGPVTSVLWRVAVGVRETSSSWRCGWGSAGVTQTWLTSWTLAEPLQPEFWFFSHTEGPAPSDGSRRQPRVQLWGHLGERAWPVSLPFGLAWACGAQPMFQPPIPPPPLSTCPASPRGGDSHRP